MNSKKVRGDELDGVLTSLRGGGYRITNARRELLRALILSPSPLSVADLVDALGRVGLTVNKTTVYRELTFLCEQKLVRELDLQEGKKRYERVGEGDHHHHLVCTNCGDIICATFDEDLSAIERSVRTRYKFQVTGHTLDFFGLCDSCRER